MIIAAQHNTPLEDLATANNYARPVIAGGTGSSNPAGAATNLQVLPLSGGTMTGDIDFDGNEIINPAGIFLKGFLFGLTLSNSAGDPTNDIDIAIGSASSDGTTPYLMTLASALTKRLDAAWAVGTNAGGLDTGSIANTTYHVWLIQRSDTGVVDALFSTSATAPTMPANYDRKRRIGSIIRSAGAIRLFSQDGDRFLYRSAVITRSGSGASGLIALAMDVPLGIICSPIFLQAQTQGTAGGAVTSFGSSGTMPAIEITVTNAASEGARSLIEGSFKTDTLAQLQFSVSIVSGTLASNVTSTYGWYDPRGRAA